MKLLFALLHFMSLSALAHTHKPFIFTSFNDFQLEGVITHTNKKPKGVAFLILQGSGPQSYDGDFSSITRPIGSENLYYKTIAELLASNGISSARYNKRSFQHIKNKDTTSKQFQNFKQNPLYYFIKDASHILDTLKKNTFKDKEIYILGHSQGSYIALQVAHLNKVSGIVHIGFSATSISETLFEQLVYRPLHIFKIIDLDQNQLLDATELEVKLPEAEVLKKNMKHLDANHDKHLSISEVKSGNLAQQEYFKRGLKSYISHEQALPTATEILENSTTKQLFLQGEWDNQTPSYNVKSIQFLNSKVWNKNIFTFSYYKERGHALDKRNSVNDSEYTILDDEVKKRIIQDIEEFTKKVTKL